MDTAVSSHPMFIAYHHHANIRNPHRNVNFQNSSSRTDEEETFDEIDNRELWIWPWIEKFIRFEFLFYYVFHIWESTKARRCRIEGLKAVRSSDDDCEAPTRFSRRTERVKGKVIIFIQMVRRMAAKAHFSLFRWKDLPFSFSEWAMNNSILYAHRDRGNSREKG